VAAFTFALRARRALSWGLIPWRIVVLTEGLFLFVSALARHGGTRFLADLSGHSVLATTFTAGAASNAVNNLPAYLAVEPAVPAGHTTQLLGALLGTNTAPLILLWDPRDPAMARTLQSQGARHQPDQVRPHRARRRAGDSVRDLGRDHPERLTVRKLTSSSVTWNAPAYAAVLNTHLEGARSKPSARVFSSRTGPRRGATALVLAVADPRRSGPRAHERR